MAWIPCGCFDDCGPILSGSGHWLALSPPNLQILDQSQIHLVQRCWKLKERTRGRIGALETFGIGEAVQLQRINPTHPNVVGASDTLLIEVVI